MTIAKHLVKQALLNQMVEPWGSMRSEIGDEHANNMLAAVGHELGIEISEEEVSKYRLKRRV